MSTQLDCTTAHVQLVLLRMQLLVIALVSVLLCSVNLLLCCFRIKVFSISCWYFFLDLSLIWKHLKLIDILVSFVQIRINYPTPSIYYLLRVLWRYTFVGVCVCVYMGTITQERYHWLTSNPVRCCNSTRWRHVSNSSKTC